MGPDQNRLRAYLRGELEAGAIDQLEAELADDLDLRRALQRVRREEIDTLLSQPVDDPNDSMKATLSLSGATESTLSLGSLSTDKLELGEILGKGGMGVVHLGRQPHLGRTVAVKRVKTPTRGDGVRALLSEAFVTGQLEHPNIVPIHDIVLDDDEEPQVVLKRIEGSSWKELLREPDAVRQRFEVEDALEWHLRVLLSVCQALRFAHSRGIVHRDVKPSNVMLGRFGEIYLLDWGLAFRVPSDDEDVEDPELSVGFGGTPAYMAPEQFGTDTVGIGPYTDVYLVGATLFEILEGRPPRSGRDLMRHLEQAVEGPPELSADAPPELVAIVRRAMAPDPDDRFASIQDLRRAIEAFLEHRTSRQLAAKAAKSALAMKKALADGDDIGAERAFAEATFGYRASLDAWAENAAAEAALSELLCERIEAALDSGAVETAERLVAIAPELPASLRERVRDAVLQHARRKKEFAQLEADQDRTAGVGTRRVLTLVVFGSWVGWWTHAGIEYPMPALEMASGPIVITVLSGLLAYLARERLSSKQNKNLVIVVLSMMVATSSWLFAAAQLGIDAALVPLPLPLLWAVSLAIGALSIDRRALPSAFVYLAGFHLAAHDPTHIRWVLAATNLFWLLNALAVNVAVARSAEARAPESTKRDAR